MEDSPQWIGAVGAIAASVSVIVSAVTFIFTQILQRRIRRARAVRELVDWFDDRRKRDDDMKKFAKQLAYGKEPFTFSIPEELGTVKEACLARLLSMLNHLAFHVELRIVNKEDLSRTAPGYYFTVALNNESIQEYLEHIDEHDQSLGRPRGSGFFYLRRHGRAIGMLKSETA